uniref:Ovule protein n=1 Tax=Ascaris lumbricoides TaxID=6252 RepID=A0A0M3IB16_ASCLU
MLMNMATYYRADEELQWKLHLVLHTAHTLNRDQRPRVHCDGESLPSGSIGCIHYIIFLAILSNTEAASLILS